MNTAHFQNGMSRSKASKKNRASFTETFFMIYLIIKFNNMEKLYCLLAGFFCLGASAQVVDIPDEFFKFKLLQASPTNAIAQNAAGDNIGIDLNDNDEIEMTEALQVAALNVANSEIFDLAGIGSFTNLKRLDCNNNFLTALDASDLSLLESLNCELNNITQLDVSGKIYLKLLYCSRNALTSLNVAGCGNLSHLECYTNQLTSLDISGLNKLDFIGCGFNRITSLEVIDKPLLTTLLCYNNELTSLVVGNLPSLIYFYCWENQLTGLDAHGLWHMQYLACFDNLLTSLNLSGCTGLLQLACGSNQLTSLELNGLNNIRNLSCNLNALTALDCSNLYYLETLGCQNNQLTYLNIKNGVVEPTILFSGNPNLSLICADASQITAITTLAIQNGNINCVVNSSCVLSNADFAAAGDMKFYPNPVATELHIESKTPIESIQIYNGLGQMVLSVASANIVDVSMLQPGTYLMSAYANGDTSTSKFIKL